MPMLKVSYALNRKKMCLVVVVVGGEGRGDRTMDIQGSNCIVVIILLMHAKLPSLILEQCLLSTQTVDKHVSCSRRCWILCVCFIRL